MIHSGNNQLTMKVLGIIFAVLILIGGWVWGSLNYAAVHRIDTVELKVDKHETRLGEHDTSLAVIETQLKEINKKLDKLLGQR
jgi:F0F1-type ATP synthase membrane subunit b/b'